MKGELIITILGLLMGANGIIVLFAKRFWDKKLKELEYKHLEKLDKLNHSQKLEEKQQETADLLYDQLEVLKKRIIGQVSIDIAHAENDALKQIIIDMVKIQCPGCYAAVMDELNKK